MSLLYIFVLFLCLQGLWINSVLQEYAWNMIMDDDINNKVGIEAFVEGNYILLFLVINMIIITIFSDGYDYKRDLVEWELNIIIK